MDKEFGKDLHDGLMKIVEIGKELATGFGKIVEIGSWLLDCLKVESGRNFESWKKEEEEKEKGIIDVSQNLDQSLKGEEEMIKGMHQRKDGRYEMRVKLEPGKYKSVYGITQRECYEKYKKETKAVKHQKYLASRTSLYDFAKKWLETYKKNQVKESTYKVYENIVENHMNKLTKDIDKYTTTDLQEYLNSLGNTRTKELAYQTLQQIYRKALQIEKINKDVSQFLVKGKVERKERISFSIEEQKLIFKNLKNNTISKYILAYLMLGARLAELKSIKKENIRKGYVLINGTKTESSKMRWVKISPKYQDVLLGYSEPIFNCQAGTIKAKMREFFEKIGIYGSTHMLRHTFATNLYYLGVDDNMRKQFLGHSSIVVTNDIYTHLDPTISKADVLEIYGDLYPEF